MVVVSKVKVSSRRKVPYRQRRREWRKMELSMMENLSTNDKEDGFVDVMNDMTSSEMMMMDHPCQCQCLSDIHIACLGFAAVAVVVVLPLES